MYRNSRRILKELKRIIFILFLVIYIAGCSSTKYYKCEESNKILKNKIILYEKDIKTLKNEIESIKKEKFEIENILSFYSISNYRLESENKEKDKEITYLRKSSISEVSSEILKVNTKVKNKVDEISSFILKKYKIYPEKISFEINDEFTNICSYYSIKETSKKFDITIYTDLSVMYTSKNKDGSFIDFSKLINNIDELDRYLILLFN